MTTSLKTIVNVEIDATLTNVLDLVNATSPLDFKKQLRWLNGTAADTADLIFHDERTLTASGTEDLDLAGSLSSAFGATLTFAELRLIVVYASTGNTNNVVVSRPASNGVPLFSAASDAIPVPPGGMFLWSCPADGKIAVTAGTGDLITITNSSSGTSVTYDVVIVGTSA